MKKRIFTALAFLCACAVCGCSVLPEQVAEHPNVVVQAVEEATYNLAEVERGDICLTKKLFFLYSQTKEERLSFVTEERRVVGVYAAVGDAVTKGQLLAEAYSEDLESELASYLYQKERLTLLNTQAEELYDYDMAALGEAYENGEITAEDYAARAEQRTSSYEEIKELNDDSLTIVELRIAETQTAIRGCKIYAGIDGVVTFILPRLEGSMSDKDVAVYRVINSDECLFRLEDTEYSGSFSVGQELYLSVNDELGYEATVRRIEPKEETVGEEPEYVVYLEPDEIDTELAVGTRCYYNLLLAEEHDVLCLPNRCVFVADGQAYVFVEDEGGMLSIKNVTIGLKGDTHTQITSGLDEGDIVIRK